MTQTDRIMNHLQHIGPISGREAMDLYGIQRLGARIWDLRHAGVEIHDQMVEGKNRYGETVRYKEYWVSRNGER